ncbi:MAG: septation protein SepH [Planctomycetaceae bacterium]
MIGLDLKPIPSGAERAHVAERAQRSSIRRRSGDGARILGEAVETHLRSVNVGADSVTWDAQVNAEGEYEVELHYACRAADIGCVLELSFQESRLQATIQVAHEPPLQGEEHDRVQRRESYVKNFRALTLGRIHLHPGRGPLQLKALKIPGAEAIEFRLLMFRRTTGPTQQH